MFLYINNFKTLQNPAKNLKFNEDEFLYFYKYNNLSKEVIKTCPIARDLFQGAQFG